MNLIGKFSDYYDSAVAWGVDETQRLKRVNEKTLLDWQTAGSYKSSGGVSISVFYVGFCGEWITGVKVVQDAWQFRFEGSTTYCYSEEDLQKIHWLSPSYKNHMYDPLSSYRRNSLYTRAVRWMENKHFNYQKDTPSDELFYDKHCSVMMILHENHYAWEKEGLKSGMYLHTWPTLKDVGFAKVKDPYTAFQEISMFQFGVLGNIEDNTTNISDKDMVVSKGFDIKTSFRKAKTKRSK